MAKTDKYGNNTNFPDSVMSDMTTKGLLGKWTDMVISDAQRAVLKYYAKTRNIDAGDLSFVRSLFVATNDKIKILTPVLEDLCNRNLYGIEDITIAVFGVGSDEVFVLREFLKRMQRINEWDTDFMWNDFSGHERLKKICCG